MVRVAFSSSGTICTGASAQAKCTLGDETRLLHIGPNVSYAEMLEGVKAKFPNAGPFALKFVDRYDCLFDCVEVPTVIACSGVGLKGCSASTSLALLWLAACTWAGIILRDHC